MKNSIAHNRIYWSGLFGLVLCRLGMEITLLTTFFSTFIFVYSHQLPPEDCILFMAAIARYHVDHAQCVSVAKDVPTGLG